MASAGRVETGPDLADDAGGRRSADAAAIAAIEGALGAVRRRVRLQRALSGASVLAVAGLGVLALALAAAKLGDPAPFAASAALGAASPLLGALAGALQRCPPLLCARLIDRALRQPDLIASAHAFARLPADERSPFMRACILQAGARARAVDAGRVMPLRAPRALRSVAALAIGVALLAALEVERPASIVAAARPRPRLLHQDDVQAFQQEVAPLLSAPETDPLLRSRAEELNALLEALHGGELDRAQALAELRAIEKKLELEGSEAEDQALREALQALGRALAGDALAKPVADAFQSGRAEEARAELERLADRLERAQDKRDALRKLADALARAGRAPADRGAVERAKQELDRLLQKKDKDKAQQDPAADRLLRDKRRELERLQREQQQRDQAQRSLDDLRRDLSNASPPLQGQRGGEAAERLRSAARQLRDSAQKQRSAQQRGQLAERLGQLRELLSKQGARAGAAGKPGQNGKPGDEGQAGAGRRLDMEKFARAARGQAGKPGDGGDKNDEGKQPDGMLIMPGQGRNGSEGEMVPGDGASSSMHAQGEVLAPSQGEPGEGGRPQLGDATRSDGTRIDTRVQGEAGDKGPTRSQVIREAGQRGFVTRGYERVHADYERHAEAVLEHDRVPGGYRFYVRRYFQLIRPREGEP